jgi:hypothetical protein
MSKAKRRASMGTDPLDLVVGRAIAVPEEKNRTVPRRSATDRAQAAIARPPKERATFHITSELFDLVKDAVVALSGPPARLTLAEFAETALRRELERLQRAHNEGKPFPKREGPLKGGRPIGS